MEEHLSPASALGEQIEGLAGRLETSRAATHDLLGNQRTKLAELEATINDRIASLQQTLEWQQATQGQLDELAAELTESQQQLESREGELTLEQQKLRDRGRRIAGTFRRQRSRNLQAIHAQREQIETLAAAENEQLIQAREQLEQQAHELGAVRADLEQTQAARATDSEQLRQTRAELDGAHAELERVRQELDVAQSDLQQQREENQRLAEQLATQQETERSRSEELEVFRAEHAGLTAALGEAETAVEAARAQVDAQNEALEESRGEREQLAHSLEEAQECLQAALQERGTQSAECHQTAEEIQRLSQVNRDLEEQLTQLAEARQNETAEVEGLRRERDDLALRLADAEREAGASPSGGQELEDLNSRLQMSLDDLREMKSQNEGLQRELAAARSSAPPKEVDSGGGQLDWEAQKRRLLAELDDEFECDDPAAQEERASIEDRIRSADQVIAAKDLEIETLRQTMEQALANSQADSDAAAQAGVKAEADAQALAEVLDKDELIARERAQLELLQQEWREKLTAAEIDISVERANLARERAKMEDQLQTINSRTISASGTVAESPSGEAGRSRWLTRLGLHDGDDS